MKPGTNEADANLAWRVIGRGVQCGVMLFGPVGFAGASVKISPPLMIEQEALEEGMQVVEQAFAHELSPV